MANEKRLIDANALSCEIDSCSFETSYDFEKVLEIIAEAHTVDAVEVVRCKDCQFYLNRGRNCWCDIFDTIMPENGYCCFGERKPNDSNNL